MGAQHVSSPGAKISCCNQSFDLRPASSDSQTDSQDRCRSSAPHYSLFLSCEMIDRQSGQVSLILHRTINAFLRLFLSCEIFGGSFVGWLVFWQKKFMAGCSESLLPQIKGKILDPCVPFKGKLHRKDR